MTFVLCFPLSNLLAGVLSRSSNSGTLTVELPRLSAETEKTEGKKKKKPNLKELASIEPGSLEDLHLTDVDILQGIDALSLALDFLANHLRNTVHNKEKKKKDMSTGRIKYGTYNFWTRSLRSEEEASRLMMLNIFFRICLIWECWA
jgi:hypothetical protein